MIEQAQDRLAQRMQWAIRNSAMCLAPYTTVDIRHDDNKTTDIFQTCCCNLDAKLFVPAETQDAFADLKQQQLQGIRPAACHRCWDEEKNGGQSERLRAFAEIAHDKFEQFAEDQTISDFEFRVKFSNLCSLACRSCGAEESSTFAKITNTEVNDKFEIDISNDNVHWNFITSRIMTLTKKNSVFFVHFIGGETLIQPGMIKLLQWIVRRGIAPNVHLRLTTAITVNPSTELLELLSMFNSVDINFSIDSVGENYQYVRWPAKFEKVENNLDILINYQSVLTIKNGQKVRVPKWKCAVSPVFSLNNIFYIDDWLDYWNQWYQQRGIVFHNFMSNMTMQTNHLDIQALPTQYRPTLASLLKRCLTHPIFETYPAHLSAIYTFLTLTIAELENNRYQPELWEKFLRHTAYFDQKTKLSFAIFNQRLYNILTTADQEKFKTILVNTNTSSSLTQAMIFRKI